MQSRARLPLLSCATDGSLRLYDVDAVDPSSGQQPQCLAAGQVRLAMMT